METLKGIKKITLHFEDNTESTIKKGLFVNCSESENSISVINLNKDEVTQALKMMLEMGGELGIIRKRYKKLLPIMRTLSFALPIVGMCYMLHYIFDHEWTTIGIIISVFVSVLSFALYEFGKTL